MFPVPKRKGCTYDVQDDSDSALEDSDRTKVPDGIDEDCTGLDSDAHKFLQRYLVKKVEEYRRLRELRKKGWQSSQADDHFKKQRQTADSNNERKSQFFYNMMRTIASDLDKETGALTWHSNTPRRVLDMCAAPGGFIDQTMAMNPGKCSVRAMSLPVEDGGHDIRLENNDVNVKFRDITMLAGEMYVFEEEVPDNFSDRDKLVFDTIFDRDEKYDLVFCDGQVLRTHQRSEWREPREATRLTVTQLALGLQHLKTGGTMVILMHKLDSWRSFELVFQFSQIANVSLYKHHNYHKTRSSFYLVARDVGATTPYAADLVDEWRNRYRTATFGSEDEWIEMHNVGEQTARFALRRFGKMFVEMGTKIWKTQADGLENAWFIKNK